MQYFKVAKKQPPIQPSKARAGKTSARSSSNILAQAIVDKTGGSSSNSSSQGSNGSNGSTKAAATLKKGLSRMISKSKLGSLSRQSSLRKSGRNSSSSKISDAESRLVSPEEEEEDKENSLDGRLSGDCLPSSQEALFKDVKAVPEEEEGVFSDDDDEDAYESAEEGDE